MSTIYSIYKLTNTANGKSYIGFTSKIPERRWQMHLENAKKKRNQYLYDAINKYGWDNFTKEVLYQSKDGQHTLNEMEPYFIQKYDTFFMNDKGYNMSLGGGGSLGHKHTEKFKKKRSKNQKGVGNSFYGKHHTEEYKKQKGEQIKKTRYLRVGELAPNYGKRHTAEIKKQIGDTQGGSWIITFPDEHIETIHNLREFCRQHNLTTPLMLAVSTGKQHHHKGFKCQKAPGYEGGVIKWKITDPEGKEFIIENLMKWSQENKISYDELWRVSKGKISHHKGYKCEKCSDNIKT